MIWLYVKKEEIWLSPMTKAPTLTEQSKKQLENTKTTQKTSITQRLRTDLGRSVGVTIATQLVWLNRKYHKILRNLIISSNNEIVNQVKHNICPWITSLRVLTYLFDEVNTGLKVHAEVDEFPLNSFLLVLFLFQDEHVVVEKLLQTLVRVVDT